MESTTINNSIKEVRELFNEITSNLSCEEINRIRKKLYKKEIVYNFMVIIYYMKAEEIKMVN